MVWFAPYKQIGIVFTLNNNNSNNNDRATCVVTRAPVSGHNQQIILLSITITINVTTIDNTTMMEADVNIPASTTLSLHHYQ